MGHPAPAGLAFGIHVGIISVPDGLGSLAARSAAVAHTTFLGTHPLCVYCCLFVNILLDMDSLIRLHWQLRVHLYRFSRDLGVL